ncbi:MAG: ABC transporter substrate-binding protein [Rhodocyclaceae bacterium]|nr:ABC transporter substrate-binding protein [Rhodocyclaceae bacterium]MCP5232441.1 ABC transporter substrate-binding protein [Zoogloeaceae bacterium]MCB1911078.1 ABC transporter substrate-binding protein [Rhodocyclaceae bacterium]MCP5240149.1 ABC transporter substrate-binding protein [Zoogloeaceae bacterium]MCP5255988.1 ABC transporter substrate-binding protein [Zoogloeaceae bacterium]
MKLKKTVLLGATIGGLLAGGYASAAEQFIGLPSYRVGPYAAGGSALFGAWIDYMQMINERDGGVGGVKLVWEECETEYNNARGVECYERLKNKGETGNSVFQPISTGITYSVLEKVAQDKIPMVTIGYGRTDAADGRIFPWVFPMVTTYWSQASGIVNYIGMKEGGMDKLKGKKIGLLYHDSAYGKESHAIMDKLAAKHGFEVIKIPVAHPGNEQQSQWLQIRQAKPDYVILWGWGVMNPTAIKSAAKTGYPREKMIGVWWSGAEEDTVPAGSAAKGFTAAGFNVAGTNYPLIKDIEKHVYAKGKGNMEDKSRVGGVYYNRGVVSGIITVEAIRKAQEKYGQGKALTGEQMRWGFENLNMDAKHLASIGATGFMPEMQISCLDHEGSGKVKFQQWDGSKWKVLTDWVDSDKPLVRGMIEESAAAYAKEKGITPRDCSKEM